MTRKAAHGIEVHKLDQHEVVARQPELAALLTSAIDGAAISEQLAVGREVSSTLALAVMSPAYATMVAADGGELCGAIIAELVPSDRQAFVRWLAVCPRRRREGIGTLLADHLDRLVRPGLIRGMVDLDDLAASTFWEQRGWASLVKERRRIPMGMRLDS